MKKILIILLTLSLLMVVGCSNNNEVINNVENNLNEVTNEPVEEVNAGITFIDTSGNEVVLEDTPKRVIALYASFADLWFEAGGELVGINDSSTLPEKALDLPKLGKMSAPNIEAMLVLEPDFVILRSEYGKHVELASIFEENNIQVMFVDYSNFEETMEVFKIFCEINKNENLYEDKGLSMISKIEEIVAEKLQFSYLLLFSTSKSVSAKDNNITSGIINDFGGENIVEKYSIANEESKQFSFEKILEIDPKFIFVQTMGSVEDAKARMDKDITSNPAWGSLTAVKENRFIYLPKDLFLYKPNMRFVEAYEYIADILKIIK